MLFLAPLRSNRASRCERISYCCNTRILYFDKKIISNDALLCRFLDHLNNPGPQNLVLRALLDLADHEVLEELFYVDDLAVHDLVKVEEAVVARRGQMELKRCFYSRGVTLITDTRALSFSVCSVSSRHLISAENNFGHG